MSHLSLSIASVAFLVLIGSLPCLSKECSSAVIQECWNQEFNDYCPFYQKIADCMDSIEKNCEDDQIKNELDYNLKGSKARAEQCPGLKDGECFAGALVNCHTGIPFDVKNNKELTDDEKKTMCQEFSGKEQAAKDCMNELKTKCTSEHATNEINMSLEDVDDIQKTCANFN